MHNNNMWRTEDGMIVNVLSKRKFSHPCIIMDKGRCKVIKVDDMSESMQKCYENFKQINKNAVLVNFDEKKLTLEETCSLMGYLINLNDPKELGKILAMKDTKLHDKIAEIVSKGF